MQRRVVSCLGALRRRVWAICGLTLRTCADRSAVEERRVPGCGVTTNVAGWCAWILVVSCTSCEHLCDVIPCKLSHSCQIM